MDTIIKTACIFLLSYIFSSCVGIKKINFETAYKFSRYNYHKTEKNKSQIQDNAYVSLDLQPVLKQADEGTWGKISMTENIINLKLGYNMESTTSMNATELHAKFHKLTKQEKREIRREIKSELKSMKNLVAKNAIDTDHMQRAYASTDLTRLAIIIGGTGLVLLILGAIFSGFLAFVGAIAVVAAAVLFIIDQT